MTNALRADLAAAEQRIQRKTEEILLLNDTLKLEQGKVANYRTTYEKIPLSIGVYGVEIAQREGEVPLEPDAGRKYAGLRRLAITADARSPAPGSPTTSRGTMSPGGLYPRL